MNETAKKSYPLSMGQKAMWFIYQMAPENVAYNIFITVKINSNLDINTFIDVWNQIVQRHPILRTIYTVYEGKPSQQINQQQKFSVQITDASCWSEDELKEKIFAETDRPFNLETDSVIRINLFTRSVKEHIFLLTMHHITGDLRTADLLICEFQSAYAFEIKKVSQGQTAFSESALKKNNSYKSYTEFVNWQLEMLSSAKGEKLWQYWQEKLAGELPVLNLPTDKPRPPVKTYQGTTHILELDQVLIDKINHLALVYGISLYNLLLTAFHVLIYRYSNQKNILIATPMRGRSGRDFQGSIGYFVNRVILRTSLEENTTFEQLITQVGHTVKAAQRHQHYPFSLLVEKLRKPQYPGYSPLCQVGFTWQLGFTWQSENRSESLLEMSHYPLGLQRGADLDLNLMVIEAEEVFQLCWQYNTDLFEATTIASLAGHFVTLLEGIVTNPQQPISQIPILTEIEAQQLLINGNNTQVNYRQDQCIHQLFEEQVKRTPDNVAVVFEGQKLTYNELNIRANQLAQYLKSLGVGTDDLVGICVERSLEMIVGLLGILKAGGGYVPLDPAYPQERLACILSDANVAVLLTQEKLVTKLPENRTRVVCFDRDWEAIVQEREENLVSDVKGNNLAYVIYTSGSTGQPKGVMIEHGSVLNLAKGLHQAIYAVHDEGQLRVSLNGPLAFDTSVKQVIQLLYGHTLDIVPEFLRFDGSALLSYLQHQPIDVFDCTPSQLGLLISAGLLDSNIAPQHILVGGEPIDESTWQTLIAAKNIHFYNVYGPTECTVDATVCAIGASEVKPAIGRPIANTQVYILDSQLQPVPIGVAGELHIGGAGLARGYLNRPDLTAEKFISNPFHQATESRLYKTGDLARYLPDGNIEYLGRIDHQVKIRGFRIELGEIEAVLNQRDEVQTACVIVREDNPGNQLLVAYIVPKLEGDISTSLSNSMVSELRQFLKTKLPDYMVPNAFLILESLPLTPNGKVDRRALPVPDLQSQKTDEYEAARNAIEEMLTEVWIQVLKVEKIGIHDNFFDLGGHSLLATQLASRIRSNFQVELPLRHLFTAPTIAELGQLIKQLKQQQTVQITSKDKELELTSFLRSSLVELSILPRPQNAELPLSFAQTRLWFLDQFEPNSALYNVPLVLLLEGTLNLEALEQSLGEIIRRHEVLRTNFITVDGQPIQVIQPKSNLGEKNPILSLVDLSHLPTTQREKAVQDFSLQQAIQPFNLAEDFLLRTTLVVLSETEKVLLISMHHIISDGWSGGVLRVELATLYNAYCQGLPYPLSDLSIQYADFAIWQRQWLQGEVLQTQLNYWQKQLTGAPALLSLPTDHPRPAMQRFRGLHQEFALSRELSQKLNQLSREQGVTLFMTLLAAFDTLLYRYTDQEDIVVGCPIANRNRREIEGLIGFFVNTLVLRVDLSGDPSFEQLLTRLREVAIAAYSHQDLPFEMLVEALQPQRDLSYTPLFQVMFVLQNAPESALEMTGLTMSYLPRENATAKFDLTLSLDNTNQGLVGVWEYNTDLFDASTIERMTGHFVTLLEGIVANPQQRISQLPLLTEIEQRQLLIEWNNTQVDYPQDQCIHQLFEEQVGRTPDAIAVVFEDQLLTYRELNSRANQLAHYLQSLGVKADSLVGLSVERSPLMIVAILGILKAGGAYVPLDPAYPSERLHFMVEDAQLAVLVTQEQLLESIPKHSVTDKTPIPQVICLDKDWEKIAQKSDSNLESAVKASNLAYVIYTSGSTGKPKGVLVSHAHVVRLFKATEVWYHFDNQDVWTLFHSYAFDFSVWEIWGALFYGGKLVIVPHWVTRSPESFYQLLCQEQVTILNQTPSAFRQLIQVEQSPPKPRVHAGFGGATVENLSLRLVIFGGEALEIKGLQPWFERHGDRHPQLVNMYGITETTVHVTYRPLTQADLQSTASVIGRPISDLQVYVLDRYLQPVPVGIPGEMYVGGAGVTRGYLNRPELTAERFIRDPFSSELAESRLYKTGDLACYLPNGELKYLGRIDNQVKIRGFRIELGEIEALLAQHPMVWECVVTVREDQAHDQRLVAYVVPPSGESPAVSELRSFLQERLPDYMIPNAIVFLEALPLTPSGKVDRRHLPTPPLPNEQTDNFIHPRTPIEQTLAQIWQEVLKVEQVGIQDNFFALGGHSLLATQVVSRIGQLLKVKITLRTLFNSTTLADLAGSITQLQQEGSDPTILTTPPILPRRKR